MTSTPEKCEGSCAKVSVEEAQKQMKETTEAELSKLAELMKTHRIPVRQDVMSEEEINTDTSDSEESEYDSDYVPSKRKRQSTKSMHLQQDVESKMYIDNQKLWKKIHKYGIELNRHQKELHYMQLELNNKNIECNDYKQKCKNIDILLEKNKIIYQRLIYIRYYNIFYAFLLALCAIDYIKQHTFFPKVGSLVFFVTKLFFVFCMKLQNKLLL